ncbi:hypothetical protein OS493_032629 [Desmophyllum pertusum]|uniref:Uncharacterized protein n=1 Tax=Desmophyllum pertusum TaxID=174260 RepID=A0A9W9YMA3_9CNID|nr:hypothetical protein OS493_032629 [Desmophyllum pertusum]
MKDDLGNAHAKMDQYKSRLASLSEKCVKRDQRLVEDTLASNRQSELERDFSAFFDEDRMDACEKMQSIYHNKEETYQFIYYPRLACIIFETAYEQVKEAKEVASDLFKELIKNIIDLAPQMGQFFSTKRKSYRKGQDHPSSTVTTTVNIWGDGAEYSKDIMDGMMLSLKEVAHTCSLDHFVDSVSTIAFEKWTKWHDEEKSCMFTPSKYLVKRSGQVHQGLHSFDLANGHPGPTNEA